MTSLAASTIARLSSDLFGIHVGQARSVRPCALTKALLMWTCSKMERLPPGPEGFKQLMSAYLAALYHVSAYFTWKHIVSILLVQEHY
jgi:hypothetical protein